MTTTHPNDGELRAFLDGEAAPEREDRIRSHLRACDRCRDASRSLEAAGETARRALALLAPPARTARALRQVEGRLERKAGGADAASAGPAPRPSFNRGPASLGWGSLARAALLVLALGAGVSAAVPGSPVRAWLGAAWSSLSGGGAPRATAVDAGPAEQSSAAADEAGVRVAPAGGEVRVELSGVAGGTPVWVRLVDRASAGVAAPGGARFRSADGSIRADLAGVESGGEVRVELPRGVGRADVLLEGRALLRIRSGRVELPGPAPERPGGDYLFRDPGASGTGDPGR